MESFKCKSNKCLASGLGQITTLNLDSQGVYKLTNLSGLVNLRWASFDENDISKVEGLDSCVNLEELSLNNNNISTLSGESGRQLRGATVPQPGEL